MVTYALIVGNVAIFAVCAAQASSTDLATTLPPLFDRWLLSGVDLAAGDYWRLLTAGFLHASLFHLAVNMGSLYVIGRTLEPALGSAAYTLVYFTALFGGSAAVVLLGEANVLTVGASGAIYGLMGALLIVVLRARQSVAPVVGIIVVNVVLSVTLPGISILAHFGGLLFGALSASAFVFVPGLMLRNPASRTPARLGRARQIAWALAGGLLILAILLGALAPAAR